MGAITSYRPGDGTPDHRPEPLVTTPVAAMERTEAFRKMLRVESERRGMSRAGTVLVMGNGVPDDCEGRNACCIQPFGPCVDTLSKACCDSLNGRFFGNATCADPCFTCPFTTEESLLSTQSLGFPCP